MNRLLPVLLTACALVGCDTSGESGPLLQLRGPYVAVWDADEVTIGRFTLAPELSFFVEFDEPDSTAALDHADVPLGPTYIRCNPQSGHKTHLQHKLFDERGDIINAGGVSVLPETFEATRTRVSADSQRVAFRTLFHVPSQGRDIELSFEGMQSRRDSVMVGTVRCAPEETSRRGCTVHHGVVFRPYTGGEHFDTRPRLHACDPDV
jgi:hypothetical protein